MPVWAQALLRLVVAVLAFFRRERARSRTDAVRDASAVATQEATDEDSNALRGKTAHESAVAIRKPGKRANGYRAVRADPGGEWMRKFGGSDKRASPGADDAGSHSDG